MIDVFIRRLAGGDELIRREWVRALCASVALVSLSPVVGRLTSALRTALPGMFVLILSVGVAASVLLVTAITLSRIREKRTWRYAAIAGALFIAAAYSRAAARGIGESDAVERFHFI